mmetsp:Transcript_25883/g.41545  ORF Transcript_25883/g.41545 Transcript_25883/m.41545 type:complete len:205 (-) Transcript_25883:20-634(-)
MVLLPGPAMPMISGPPSAFALSMRPWLMAVFILFLPVAVARFLVLDIIGGVFLILTAGIGCYALKGSMDISWLLCLSIILFLNAVFDAFILGARAMDTRYPLFGKTLNWQANAVHGTLLLGPVVEFVSAIICWRIYRDHVANILGGDEDFVGLEDGGVVPAQAAGRGFRGAPVRNSTASLAQGSTEQRRSTFEAFQGQGHRLSD